MSILLINVKWMCYLYDYRYRRGSTLKNELLEMKESIDDLENETYPKESIQETSGELSMYDNHPADTATALFEREKDFALHEHAESDLGKVEIALKAMAEGTYGKCEVCNDDIFRSNDLKLYPIQPSASNMHN